MLSSYEKRLSKAEVELKKSVKQMNLISSIRLLLGILFAFLIYQLFQKWNPLILGAEAIVLVGFFLLIKIHLKFQFQKRLNEAQVRLNQEEIDFLRDRKMPFDAGVRHLKIDHTYALDLDLFGEHSLFQYLNRTHLESGSLFLSHYLLNQPGVEEINNRQEAIKELNGQLDWRQNYTAHCITANEKEHTFNHLKEWARRPLNHPKNGLRTVAYILPILLFICVFMHYVLSYPIFGNWIQPLVIINLLVALSQVKFIKNELVHSDKINHTLHSYGLLIEQIEQQSFNSKKLKDLQRKLTGQKENASTAIQKLSRIYSELENIKNPFGALFFNALLLYHIHAFHKLKIWKQKHAKNIENWIQVLGEFEALNSLSNFSCNEPHSVFPDLNSNEKIEFTELGHPLLSVGNRINNDIRYDSFRYIILTGSNMSGKSTFLRSLGINMVLAQAGGPVCAKKANIHPMPILVSMRVNDSLGEGESFFFAEVKRLKQLMELAEKETSFVLLDEILRGTNSDDKRSGTVEVIKSIIDKKAFGAIATHDLKVCETTAKFPNVLSNKCFEVEIKNDELVFDYQLREGICQNKSATFLMKKMGVI